MLSLSLETCHCECDSNKRYRAPSLRHGKVTPSKVKGQPKTQKRRTKAKLLEGEGRERKRVIDKIGNGTGEMKQKTIRG